MSYIPSQAPYTSAENQNLAALYGGGQISAYPSSSDPATSYAPPSCGIQSVESDSQGGVQAALLNVVNQLVVLVSVLVNKLLGNSGGLNADMGSAQVRNPFLKPEAGYAPAFGMNESLSATNSSGTLDQLSSLWDFGKQIFSGKGEKLSELWGGVKSFFSGLF